MLSPEEKRARPTTITLIVGPTLRGRLEELAKDNERSLGAEARVAIRQYVERHEDEEAA